MRPARTSAARRTAGLLACAAATAATAAGIGAWATSPDSTPSHATKPLLFDAFSTANGPNHLITSEYALHNADGVQSPKWEMTSGSFFTRAGAGWSGAPDTTAPDRESRRSTGSAVFRLRTAAASFRDVEVTADVRVDRWSRSRPGALPAVVLWLRYASERRLYWPSVLRADGKVDVEKKVPRGPFADNGGTYYILPPYTVKGWPVKLGRWYHLALTARNGPGGAVTISTYRDGRRMLTAVDRGAGQVVQYARTGRPARNPSAALAQAGRLGIRADDADFSVRDFSVRALAPEPSSARGRPVMTDG